jgi:hypothetical protein
VTKPTLISIEGPEKTTRGGMNGSQSKFLEGTRPMSQTRLDAPSLLTRSRPSIYRHAIGPRNQARNRSGNPKRCQQDHMQYRRQKSDRRQYISSQSFHRTISRCVREITMGEQLEPRILESFDPMTESYTGFTLQQSIQESTQKSKLLRRD